MYLLLWVIIGVLSSILIVKMFKGYIGNGLSVILGLAFMFLGFTLLGLAMIITGILSVKSILKKIL